MNAIFLASFSYPTKGHDVQKNLLNKSSTRQTRWNSLHRTTSLHPLMIVLPLIGLFILCLLFPYSGDDWMWGSSDGLDLLASGFDNYNGRWAGNFLVLLLTRNVILRSICMAACLVGIAWAVNKLASRKDSAAYWITLILIALLPVDIRAQAVVWTSGFCNYVASTFFILLYFVFLQDRLKSNSKNSAKWSFLLFLLGMISSLFMENLTIALFATSAIVLIYTRIRYGYWDKTQIGFILGCALGSALMFSNSVYWSILSGTDEYRDVAQSKSTVRKFLTPICLYLILDCYGILLLGIILGAALCIQAKRCTGKLPWLHIAATALFAIAFIFSIHNVFILNRAPGHIRLVLGGILTILIFCTILAWTIQSWRQGSRLPLLCFIFLAIQVLPLFVINPVGARNFFPTYITLITLLLCISANIIPSISPKTTIALTAICIVLFIPWFTSFTQIATVQYEREQLIDEAKRNHASELVIPKLPHEDCIWHSDPTRWGMNRFKTFYGIPNDMMVKMEE